MGEIDIIIYSCLCDVFYRSQNMEKCVIARSDGLVYNIFVESAREGYKK